MSRPAALEWDDAKAASNLAKHGVPFQAAEAAFADGGQLDMLDDRRDYGEERRNLVGMADGVLISVIYTMRGSTARIISARFASRKERAAYGHRSLSP